MSTAIIGRNPRILIVDDTRAIHDDFRKILGPAIRAADGVAAAAAQLFNTAAGEEPAAPTLSFELDSAFQGEEALGLVTRALADHRPYAMAFVDVRMPPGWDGVETAARLWAVQPDLQVVICTAYSDYSWGEFGARFGYSDRWLVLKKPFDAIEVQQIAAALTEKWRLTQEAKVRIEELEERVRQRAAELEKTLAELAHARKMEAVGQLAGGVAHDFNNILTANIMQLGLLRHHPDATPEIQEAVTVLESMAQRAAALTRQLLTFSRRQVMHFKVIDLNATIEQLLVMLNRLLDESIKVDFRPSAGPLWINADVGMMDQVVTNLCVNARDAMRPGGGRLTIATAEVNIDAAALPKNSVCPPGLYVRLTIQDTGCGMDAATLQRIFEPFFTTKEVGHGTGLGLATVYAVVQQHHGWTDVRSEVGKGSTFDVYLPRAVRQATSVVQPPKGEIKPGSACILLVEDEQLLRVSVCRALRMHGYRVLEASDGVSAADVWKEHSADIDLLFSDIVMPNAVSGLELVRKFKAERPELKAVITSGYSVDLARSGVPDHPDIMFLAKPYTVSDLMAVLTKCLPDRPPS